MILKTAILILMMMNMLLVMQLLWEQLPTLAVSSQTVKKGAGVGSVETFSWEDMSNYGG
jgi:hypothetical protein